MSTSKELCHGFEENLSIFSDPIINVDKTSAHQYKPEIKEQSIRGNRRSLSRNRRGCFSFFCYNNEIIMVDYFEQAETITGNY